MDNSNLSQLNQKKLSQIDPSVRSLMMLFLYKAEQAGYPLLIVQGYRTLAEQAELYAKGRRGIKGEKIVTNAKPGYSWHNYGLAIDVVDPDKLYNMPESFWQAIGKIGESVGLEWGGRWTSFPDRPHFQYVVGVTYAQAASGKRPTVPNNINDKDMQEQIDKLRQDHEDFFKTYGKEMGEVRKRLDKLEAWKPKVKEHFDKVENKIKKLK